jgi:transcriptional regulator with XRE-family HTH domain
MNKAQLMKNAFGRVLRRKRKERWTLGELAEKLGVTKSHLSQVENGKRALSFDTLQSLLDILEIKYSIFIQEVEEEVEKKKREFKYEISRNDLKEICIMIERLELNGASKTLIQRLREKLRVPEWLREENRRAYIRETFENDLPIIGDQEESAEDAEVDEA